MTFLIKGLAVVAVIIILLVLNLLKLAKTNERLGAEILKTLKPVDLATQQKRDWLKKYQP